MIETVYFSLIVVMTLLALANWRLGLYLAIFMDVARDPIRKLSESQSVWITIGGGAIWGGVFLGALMSDGAQIRSLFQRYRQMATAFTCFLLALVPGIILSLTLYVGGYKLAMIGCVSYLAPCIGVAVGFLIPVRERDLDQLFRFYAVVNAVALVGTLAEYRGIDFRILGGIDMEWLRYRQGYVVRLISGVYRSPDIMGLHAAHVVLFSLILAHRSPGTRRAGWLGVAGWGLLCLFLSGRRKMLGIPLVFVAGYMAIGMWRGSRTAGRLASAFTLLALAGGLGLMAVGDNSIGNRYVDYAGTLFTEGIERSRSVVEGGVIATLYQSGILGSGIGSATQGSHYVNVSSENSWQEDGVSRMFKELGVPGVILLCVFLILILGTVLNAMSLIPPQSRLAQLQIAVFACVLANGASFAISHQQYSGDPGSAILVLLMFGMVLGLPRVYAREFQMRSKSQKPIATVPELAAT